MISFVVHGVPAGQGSKVANRYGGFREANPNTRPWRAAVTAEAARVMDGKPLLTGPLELRVRFVFPRPKSHYRTGRHSALLKPSAPVYVAGKPDLDKLLRAIGDSLTGVCIRDDALIADVQARKVYGESAGCVIDLYSLAGDAAEDNR